jgi:hypothetical protein
MMELTHEESPWLDTYGKSQVIDNELLKDEKKERKEAARFLLIDYLYDNELTDSSIVDAEDIYEY